MNMVSQEEARRLVDLADAQRQLARKRTAPDNHVTYFLWAVAYLLTYGALFVIGAFLPARSSLAGLAVFAPGLVALAVVVFRGVFKHQGLRNRASQHSQSTGMAWLVALLVSIALNSLVAGLSNDAEFSSTFPYFSACVLVGAVYVSTAVRISDPIEFRLGCWLIGTGGVALMLPAPFAFLMVSVLAPTGFFLAALDARAQQAGAAS